MSCPKYQPLQCAARGECYWKHLQLVVVAIITSYDNKHFLLLKELKLQLGRVYRHLIKRYDTIRPVFSHLQSRQVQLA